MFIPPLKDDIGEGKLHEAQLEPFSEIHEWLTGTSPVFVLRGPAGTGKTYIIKYLLSKYLKDWSSSIVLCAPTNQAVKVLKSLNTACDCMTIYSLLGLRMVEHEDTLRLEKAERSLDGAYKIVLLDEAGMVGEELLEYVKESVGRGVRYLMLGDNHQNNPVGEGVSLVWSEFPGTKLTKVIRYDNQILNLATHIRKTKHVRDLDLRTDNNTREGVWVVNNRKFERKIIKYAQLGLFSENSRVIAWRNNTVEHFNQIIRTAIFGETAAKSKWVVNDIVLFAAPFEDKELHIKAFTDDEGTVSEVVVAPHTHFPFLTCYYLTLKMYNGRSITVKTVHENSQYDFDMALTGFANEARSGKKEQWKSYWALRNSVVQLKHGFAITTHRSQGSSRRNVFVVADDILANTNRDEAKRCLYTAVTRATTKVFIR